MGARRVRWRSDLEVRRSVRRLLRGLDVRPPLDVEVLIERFGEKRGRPINLLPHSLPVPGPVGLWLATTRVDIIMYQTEATAGHQEHIILHELGHIISDHPGDEKDDDLLRELLPALPLEAVQRALRRTGYDAAHEREAELVASVIKDWAALLGSLEPATPAEPSTTVDSLAANRLRRAIADRQGWM